MVSLPEDLMAFLKSGKMLAYDSARCEPGRITLLEPGKHQIGEVYVNNAHEGDPHTQDDGCYVVRAVNLVDSCEGYSPEYILLWLPDTNEYGTWDCDHYELMVFPKVLWANIVEDPLRYINAQWYRGDASVEVTAPWKQYPFRMGQH